MLLHWSKQRTAWLLLSLLALIVSTIGVVSPEIYRDVATTELMAGTIAQDLQSMVMSLLLLFLALTTEEEHCRRQTLGIGILGYLAYAYRIYAFERYYNALYFLYLAILTKILRKEAATFMCAEELRALSLLSLMLSR